MAPSIILDPYVMFNVLNDLQDDTKDLVKKLGEIGDLLQVAAKMTFAIGFGDLMDEAQDSINNVGTAAISAQNAVASGCSKVVNKLVDKFATEAKARSDYTVTPFQEITIKTNNPDRVEINPQYLSGIFESLGQRYIEFANIVFEMERLFLNSDAFWRGTSADQTRQKFKTRVMPMFEDLTRVYNQINEKAQAWIEEAILIEKALPTP